VVHVSPYYGYGWYHKGHAHYPGYPGVPEPFTVRISRLYSFRSNPRRGLFGIVTQGEHPFVGWWLVCCLRYRGQFDFQERHGAYNLLTSPVEPLIASPDDPRCTPHWPAFDPQSEVFSSGFADIAETPEHIAARVERLKTARS
jgi:hypothetical protein